MMSKMMFKRARKFLIKGLVLAALPLPFSGCGTNVAKSQAPVDTVAQAQEDMETGRYTQAQKKCEEHLARSPDDHTVRSLLAASLAAQGGLVLMTLLLEASSKGTQQESSAEGGGGLGRFLPAASAANVAALTAANTEMGRIPKTARTTAMTLQASLFLLFESLLRIKAIQENPASLASLTAADAKRIVGNLATAASLSQGSSNPFAEVASSRSQALSGAPGATEKEKLTNYVAQNPPAETVALSKPLYEDAPESPFSKEER